MSESRTEYNDVARTDPQTLVRWVTDQQRRPASSADGSLSVLLGSISVACKFMSSAVSKVHFGACCTARFIQDPIYDVLCRLVWLDF